MKTVVKHVLIFTILILQASCGLKSSSTGSNSSNFISGVISPFVGSIANNQSSPFFIQSAYASACADPVFVDLYAIKSDGSIDETKPITTQQIGADARYSFNIKTLGIANPTSNVEYLVKAEGCNGDTYKRPITNFDSNQDVDAKSTVIAEVVNATSLLSKTLNNVSRVQVELLINSVSGTSTTAALNSLTSQSAASTQFTEIFGTSPSVIQNARPEVKLVTPTSTINELAVSSFQANMFHIDPTYSAAYAWKLDGVVKSTSSSWSYVPAANESGNHYVDLYVGKNDGSGGIDLTKPYYTKKIGVIVNNNIMPTAPNFVLNTSNLSPVASNTISVDLATGVSMANCTSFSHLAITDTSTPPGVMQFNILCNNSGTQTQSVIFSSGDGPKTLYLWAIDNEGNISAAKTLSFILDTLPPVSTLSYSPTIIKGGSTQVISISASDAGIGLDTLDLYFSSNGGSTFTHLSRLVNTASSYSWTAPLIDTTNAIIKFVAKDLTNAETIKLSNAFTIDSTAPTAPAILRASSAVSSSSTVAISTTCIADYDKIIYSQSSSTPSISDSNWESCTSSKNFTITGSDGLKTVYAFTKDAVGNISLSSNLTMTLDTTQPTLLITSLNSGGFLAGGISQNITWSASDSNLTTTPISISYSTDGSVYTSIVNNIANSGSYAWTLPLINSTTVTVRVTAVDKAGNNSTVTSSNFSIDSSAPTISTFTLSNGTASVALPSTSIQIAASDSGSGLYQMRLSENSTYANSNWQTYSAAGGSYNLSLISGSKTVYVWVKDQAGNVSSPISTNISLDIGNPPVVSISSPTATSGPYSTGANVHIEWSCSSVNGLQANPARIKYTVNDGSTFVEATSWLPNNLTATTGSYEWTLPSGITVFRLLVECNSAAGVVASSYSAPINTSGWSIFAGDPANMAENVNASLALMIKGTTGFQTMGVDKLGNIFFAKNSVMMKIDSETGLVTRFAGDPSSNACNMQEGSDPLSSSFNRISNGFNIFGMNQTRDAIIFAACSKVWSFHTTTRALTLINTGVFNATPWFFSKNGFLYYSGSGYLYKLNLNLANQTPVAIMGTGTCAAVTSAAGSDATTSPMPGFSTGGCAGETYMFTNADDSKVWIGCWNGVTPCQNTASLVLNSSTGKYDIASNNVGWGMQDGDTSWCSTSYTSNRVWCSSRWTTANRTIFNTQTETWTKTSMGRQPFIRYAASPTGMVSLSSDNLLHSYVENSDNSITIGQIGGSDIEAYGNGGNFKKAAFSAIEDISYSSGLNELFIDTSVKLRKASLNTNLISTTNFNYNYLNRITVNNAGNRVSTIFNCGGLNYLHFIFDGSAFTGAAFNIMSRNACGQTVFDATYPVASGTSVNSRVDWQVDYNRRPLNHTNGKYYFFTTSSNGSNALIYSSNGTVLNIIAGVTGAAGYAAGDSGNSAIAAKLTNVRAIWEIPAGKPNAGDLLIVDNNFLRLITIATQPSTPKIYDVVAFSLALGYGSNSSNTFSDVMYDFNSELLNGSSQPILGTGAFYYVVPASNTVRKFIVTTVSGNTPTAATDTAYTFTGTTLTGNIRLAITPAGLLVTQPNKNRILRVAP